VIFHTVSYAVTKHASIGLTEWLAATYIDQGIGVSVLCPAAVRTPILAGPARRTHPKAGAQSAPRTRRHGHREARGGTIHDLPHPWVLEKFAVKARDYDEYIAMIRAGRAAEVAKAAGTA
jgi:NAD(P)-dependent dehydrogenase (short-subunit alcohol dehydrogenase family)